MTVARPLAVIPSIRALLRRKMSFQFDKLHKVFDDRVALMLSAFFFRQRAISVVMNQVIGPCCHFRGGMEGDDLFRRWMVCQKSCEFRSGLCLEQHGHGPFEAIS